MPSAGPHSRSKRDSWPPTRVRLQGGLVPTDGDLDLDLAAMDEDPLTFFLTPAPSIGDADEEDGDGDVMMMMDLDAGIEDSSRPRDMVRSISPSSLSGGAVRRASPSPSPLSLSSSPLPSPPPSSFLAAHHLRLAPTPPRRGSPDRESDGSLSSSVGNETDEEDDGEEYIPFALGVRQAFGLPLELSELAKARKQVATRQHHHHQGGYFDLGVHEGGHAAPLPLPLRPRSPRSALVRRWSSHAWREPSPDVWSIEEEAEEDGAAGKAAKGKEKDVGSGRIEGGGVTAPIDIPAAKLKKKVRFVLPPKML